MTILTAHTTLWRADLFLEKCIASYVDHFDSRKVSEASLVRDESAILLSVVVTVVLPSLGQQ